MHAPKYVCRIAAALLLTLLCLAGCADSAGRSRTLPADPQDYWYDGARQKRIWPAEDEIVLFTGQPLTAKAATALARAVSPAATVARQAGRTLYLTLNAAPEADALSKKVDTLKRAGRIRGAGRVYYGASSKAAHTRLILGHDILVQYAGTMHPEKIADLEKSYGLRRKASLKFAPNTFVYTVSDLWAVLPTANRLYESGQTVYAYPDWIKTRVKKTTKAP